jgi:hypothetical protein
MVNGFGHPSIEDAGIRRQRQGEIECWNSARQVLSPGRKVYAY